MAKRKKRYCVICGTRLRTGRKYCHVHRGYSGRDSEGVVGQLFTYNQWNLIGLVLISLMMLYVIIIEIQQTLIPYIKDNPWKIFFFFIGIIFLSWGGYKFYQKANEIKQKRLFDKEREHTYMVK